MSPAVGYASTKEVEPVLGSPWPGRELGQVRRTVRQAATLPLAVLLGVQWIVLAGRGVPETDVLPAQEWWLRQLSAVSVADHPLGATLLVACSTALAVLVRRGQRLGRAWLVLPAAGGSVVALVALLAQAVVGLGAGALAVLVLLLWLTSTWWAVGHAVLAGLAPRLPLTPRSGLLVLLAWVVLLPGPLAAGRLLLAPDLRTEAVALAANTEGLRFAALLTAVSVRLTVFGTMLGLVAWLGHQCWPRPGVRRGLRWYTALFVSLVVLLELWWTAPTLAERRVTELRYGTPVAELHFGCATWVYPPAEDAPAATPTQTVAVSGAGCERVTTYVGYHQRGTTATDVSVSPVALRAPAPAGTDEETPSSGSGLPGVPRLPTGRGGSLGPAGEPRPLVGARYGSVLVLAGTNRFDRTADQLVAVDVRGGPALWRFVCGDKREVRARFAGGQPDPTSPATNPGEPGDAVVLTCGARRLYLDPVTGLSAAR